MTIEDFFRNLFTERKITIKDAASVCGYKEQSMRNKFTRHSLSLIDIINLCCMIKCKLAIVPPSVAFKSAHYVFQAKDYISPEDATPEEIMAEALELDDFDEFVAATKRVDKAFPLEQPVSLRKKEEIVFSQLCEENREHTDFFKDGTDSYEITKSHNFGYVVIRGEKCKIVARHLQEMDHNFSVTDEMAILKLISAMENVYITPVSPETAELMKRIEASE